MMIRRFTARIAILGSLVGGFPQAQAVASSPVEIVVNDAVSATASPDSLGELKHSVEQELQTGGVFLSDGSSVRLVLDGYFVRPGGTVAVLRQLGGRDRARGRVVKIDSLGAPSVEREFSVSLRSEGIDKVDLSTRRSLLHRAVATAVMDALR